MSKILILTNNDVGLYRFRKELIITLIGQGHEVFIALPKGEWIEPLVEIGCTFIDTAIDRRGINPLTDLKLTWNYNKVMKVVSPDMVITYTIKPNVYGGAISMLRKVPYAINITGLGTAFQEEGLLKKIITVLYKLSCSKAQVVFFENEDNKRTFIELNIVNNDSSCTLNGAGVNLEEYRYCEYPKDDGQIRFLYIGRIMKEKGIDELLEAAERIGSTYKNVRFDIVGPEEECYRTKLQSLQKRGILEYHGYQKDVRPFIEKSHCFVFPSYHEGMANALLECGSMGRPLITTNIPGCREAVIEGESGYLTTVKNANDLHTNISKFIELPYESKKVMGINSMEHIKTNFDKSKVVSKTIESLGLK